MSVLTHCYKRQEEHGPESAFRFQLVSGPNRKRLFATYPDSQDSRTPNVTDKGKQRQLPKLDGLLVMSQQNEFTPNSEANQAEGSGHCVPKRTARDVAQAEPSAESADVPLVGIDMGEMLKLKEMGYEVFGPFNGPNEGPPQYQVPRTWMDRLKERDSQIGRSTVSEQPAKNPTPPPHPRPEPSIDPILLHDLNTNSVSGRSAIPITRPYPRPRPIKKPVQETAPASPITERQTRSKKIRQDACQQAEVHDDAEEESESGQRPSPKKVLGKRKPEIRSPVKIRQARSTQKRKMNNDELARLEAKELLKKSGRKSGRSRRR